MGIFDFVFGSGEKVDAKSDQERAATLESRRAALYRGAGEPHRIGFRATKP